MAPPATVMELFVVVVKNFTVVLIGGNIFEYALYEARKRGNYGHWVAIDIGNLF